MDCVSSDCLPWALQRLLRPRVDETSTGTLCGAYVVDGVASTVHYVVDDVKSII